MKITVKTKYLAFPINKHGSLKSVCFAENEQTVYKLQMKLDMIEPNYIAYIDVSRFKGKELTLTVNPEMEIRFRETDEMDLPNLYREPLRPQVHYTAKNGWINDPNGLICLNGIYHMFYQYNPADVMWQNMHWGHAVSCDLVHWEEQDIALFPNENGNVFSGCAITDERNLLGFQAGENLTGILYYTATKPFSQRMAVSTDGFQTITDCGVAIPFLGNEERDPKVVFCEELDCYIMALYRKNDDYMMFRSQDLVHWTHFFDYKLEGENEFPDILKFRDNRGKTRYILTSNTDHYVVASVENGQFRIDEGLKPLFYCSDNHSPMSFWGIPDGRCIRAIWTCYCSFLYSENFYGQMTLLEYTMEESDGKCYLAANPIRELDSLICETVSRENLSVSENPTCISVADKPCKIRLRGKTATNTVLFLNFFGRDLVFDFGKNEIRFDWRTPRVCPITVTGHALDVTVLIDRGGFEIFADGGKSCMYCIGEKAIPDRNLPFVSLRTEKGSYVVDCLTVQSLDSIWE